MRWTFKLLLISGLAYLAMMWGPWQYVPKWKYVESKEIYDSEMRQLTSFERTFLLDSSRWTTFSINQRVKEIRILSFGLQSRMFESETSPGWSLEMELYRKDGTLIKKGQASHRSRLLEDRDSIVTSHIPSLPEVIPLEGRTWKLTLKAEEQPHKLLLKSIVTPGIQNVLVKVEVGTPTIGGLRKVMWDRLNPKDRSALASSTVYPQYLLRPSEKSELLKLSKKPIGPDGIEGRDYREVNLYLVKSTENEVPIDNPVNESFSFDPVMPGWMMNYAISSNVSRVKIISETRNDSLGSEPQSWAANLMDQGGNTLLLKEMKIGSEVSFENEQLARVQIICQTAANVGVLEVSDNVMKTVRHEGIRARVWSVDGDIEIPLFIPEGTTVPIRLTVYSMNKGVDISGEVMDQFSNRLSQFKFTLGNDLSINKYITSQSGIDIPKYEIRKFIYVDQNAKSLKLKTQEKSWLQVHHRLPNWEREVDYLQLDVDDTLSWFQLPPHNFGELENYELIILPKETIDLDERIWSSRLPEEHPKKEVLMFSGNQITSYGLKNELKELKPNRVSKLNSSESTELEFYDYSLKETIQPRVMIYVYKKQANLKFYLDDQLVFDEDFPQGCTVMRLSDVSKGSHFVKWESNKRDCDVYISGVKSIEPTFIKTLGVSYKKPFNVDLPAHDLQQAIFSIRSYQFTDDPVTFRVEWENGRRPIYEMLDGEVELSRLYHVSSNRDILRLIGGMGQKLHATESMFFPVYKLHDQNKMRLKLSPISGDSQFISITAGDIPSSRSSSTAGFEVVKPVSLRDGEITRIIRESLDEIKINRVEWPSFLELKRAEKLFYDLFQGKKVDTSSWQTLGMHLEENDRYYLIREMQENGKGLYLISKNSMSKLMLQAPHRKKDLYTGKVILKYFSEYDVRAACWNTATRWVDRPDGRWHQDHCDEDHSFFNAFARAFVRFCLGALVLQIHGFSVEKHFGDSPDHYDLILSSGSKTPSSKVVRLQELLKQNLGQYKTALYPFDTKKLGALENTQGHALKDTLGSFIHFESSLEFRKKCLNEKSDTLFLIDKCIQELLK